MRTTQRSGPWLRAAEYTFPLHMPLEVGTTLGVYEVLAAIGAGGMGGVYKARDTKLDRDVALKILPDAFVNDPERLARFQRESLNCPSPRRRTLPR